MPTRTIVAHDASKVRDLLGQSRTLLTAQLGCLQLPACAIRSRAIGQLEEGFPRRLELIRQLPLCLCRHRYD